MEELNKHRLTGETLNFLKAMIDVKSFHTAEDVLEFLEKPWNWQIEYDLWVHYGRPMTSEDGGYTEFGDELDKLVMS